MEKEILEKFRDQELKLEKIYQSCEKTRKYFLFTLIITIAAVILPIVGLIIAIPIFLSVFNFGNLGL